MAQVLRIASLVVHADLIWVDEDGEFSPGPTIDPFKIGIKGLSPELASQLREQVAEFGQKQLAGETSEAPAAAAPSTNGAGPAGS